MKKIYLPKSCLQLFFSLLFFGICFLSPADVFAKKTFGGINRITEQPVTGIVRDASSGKQLEGATIAVKGSVQTTRSDANGSFTVTVPDNNSVLVISYVGYVTQEITVGN